MKATTIVFTVIFSVLSLVSWIAGGIWWFWWYPKTYEAPLTLADDASLPSSKAAYLEEYLSAIGDITGPPRYVFKRPDLDLSKQREILGGLIARFQDLAKIAPSEMAYQQGMEQLTGQEMDHQLERISGIFQSAKLRQNFLLFFLIWWGCWFFPIGACTFGLIAWAVHQ